MGLFCGKNCKKMQEDVAGLMAGGGGGVIIFLTQSGDGKTVASMTYKEINDCVRKGVFPVVVALGFIIPMVKSTCAGMMELEGENSANTYDAIGGHYFRLTTGEGSVSVEISEYDDVSLSIG